MVFDTYTHLKHGKYTCNTVHYEYTGIIFTKKLRDRERVATKKNNNKSNSKHLLRKSSSLRWEQGRPFACHWCFCSWLATGDDWTQRDICLGHHFRLKKIIKMWKKRNKREKREREKEEDETIAVLDTFSPQVIYILPDSTSFRGTKTLFGLRKFAFWKRYRECSGRKTTHTQHTTHY